MIIRNSFCLDNYILDYLVLGRSYTVSIFDLYRGHSVIYIGQEDLKYV